MGDSANSRILLDMKDFRTAKELLSCFHNRMQVVRSLNSIYSILSA